MSLRGPGIGGLDRHSRRLARRLGWLRRRWRARKPKAALADAYPLICRLFPTLEVHERLVHSAVPLTNLDHLGIVPVAVLVARLQGVTDSRHELGSGRGVRALLSQPPRAQIDPLVEPGVPAAEVNEHPLLLHFHHLGRQPAPIKVTCLQCVTDGQGRLCRCLRRGRRHVEQRIGGALAVRQMIFG